MRADNYLDKGRVFVFGEDKTRFSLDLKVNRGDIVSFKIYVLISWVWGRFEQWTDPRNESRGATFEAVYLLVGLLMYEK
jgi:hypothetical protein